MLSLLTAVAESCYGRQDVGKAQYLAIVLPLVNRIRALELSRNLALEVFQKQLLNTQILLFKFTVGVQDYSH